jgi:hypothetical protein
MPGIALSIGSIAPPPALAAYSFYADLTTLSRAAVDTTDLHITGITEDAVDSVLWEWRSSGLDPWVIIENGEETMFMPRVRAVDYPVATHDFRVTVTPNVGDPFTVTRLLYITVTA